MDGSGPAHPHQYSVLRYFSRNSKSAKFSRQFPQRLSHHTTFELNRRQGTPPTQPAITGCFPRVPPPPSKRPHQQLNSHRNISGLLKQLLPMQTPQRLPLLTRPLNAFGLKMLSSIPKLLKLASVQQMLQSVKYPFLGNISRNRCFGGILSYSFALLKPT